MNFLRLLPVLISTLLLAAHFYRAGHEWLVVLVLLLPCLLLLKRSWVPVVITVALLLGAMEWVYTLLKIAMMRAEMGMPWMRMAIILGGVALFTAVSPVVFRSKGLRRRYSDSKNPD